MCPRPNRTDRVPAEEESLLTYDAAKNTRRGKEMGRRNRTSLADDLLAVAAKLPWWLALLIAVISYWALHAYVKQPIGTLTTPAQVTNAMLPMVMKGVALVAQYAVPLLFGVAAVVSWLQRSKATPSQNDASSEKPGAPGRAPSSKSPNCPACHSPMVVRQAKRGRNAGNSFWGCVNCPHCKATLPSK